MENQKITLKNSGLQKINKFSMTVLLLVAASLFSGCAQKNKTPGIKEKKPEKIRI